MSGILGVVAGGAPVDKQKVVEASALLQHRGGHGMWNWMALDGRFVLACQEHHIDCAGARRTPLTNEDGTIVVAVDGTFYQIAETRNRLEQSGHRFRTSLNGEILIHLYEEHGIDCVSHLRGEFAFLLWDENRKRLLAARDRIGIRPLFFAEHDGAVYLASEAKAMFALGVPCRWNREGYMQMLHGVPSEHQTLFRDVCQIRPGHVLVATFAGAAAQKRYWDFKFPPESRTMDISDDEAIQKTRELLCESVQVRLPAKERVGVYLSGGIDSSAVLGIAARQLDRPIDAFTIAWHDEDVSEAPLARRTAARVGADFHVFPVNENLLADSVADAIWRCETPVTHSGVAKFLFSRMVRDHGVNVALTGEGNDGIFAGSSAFLVDNSRRTQSRRDPGMAYMQEVLGACPMWIQRDQKFRMLAPAFAAELDGFRPVHAFLDDLDAAEFLRDRHPLNVSLYFYCRITLVHFLPQVGDCVEMAHSVQGRVPFLDHRLMDYACSLPTILKIRDGQGKFVFREAVRPFVDHSTSQRQKGSFLNPLMSLSEGGSLRRLYQDTLNSSAAEDLPFFERSKMCSFLDKAVSGSLRSNDAFARHADLMLQSFVGLCLVQELFRPS